MHPLLGFAYGSTCNRRGYSWGSGRGYRPYGGPSVSNLEGQTPSKIKLKAPSLGDKSPYLDIQVKV